LKPQSVTGKICGLYVKIDTAVLYYLHAHCQIHWLSNIKEGVKIVNSVKPKYL